MKILVVVHAFPPESESGTERYAAFVARGLRDRGHDVRIFSGSVTWKPDFTVVQETWQGLDVVRVHREDLYFDHWDKGAHPEVAETFERLLDDWAPDVVHLHHWIRLDDALVRRAAVRGIPSLVHLHDFFATCPRVFRRTKDEQSCDVPMSPSACLHCVDRWSFQSDAEIASSLEETSSARLEEWSAAARRVAPTQSHADGLAAYLPESASPVTVLRHPDLRTGDWRMTPSASPAGRLRVAFFSQLHPVKGPHVLLEAVRRLGPDGGVSLDLHGAFPTEDDERTLRALADGLDVTFHGAYEAGEPARISVDVIALPFLARESHSFGLDEAMATGLPLIVSRVGALAERATGRVLLAEAGDVEAWAEAIRALRDDPERRDAMRSAEADEPMDPARHLDEVEALMQSCVTAGPTWGGEPPSTPRRMRHEWRRREWAFRELLRSEGWAQVQADLVRQVEELQRRLAGSDDEGPDGA